MTANENLFPILQGQVTRATGVAVEALDNAIVAAINAAKAAQMPQGLVVAVLHAHAHQQTSEILR